eukprot:227835-Rhodomonas_salina.1
MDSQGADEEHAASAADPCGTGPSGVGQCRVGQVRVGQEVTGSCLYAIESSGRYQGCVMLSSEPPL